MELYPRFLYHKDKSPEGTIVRTIEDEQALGEGWVPTPAMFDPNYVPPPELVAPGTIPADAAAAGYVPLDYPGMRYARDGATCIVANPDEDALLDGAVWKRSPADFPPVVETAAAPSAPPRAQSASLAPGVTDQAEAERKAAEAFAAKATELHGTAVADVLKALDGCTETDLLQKVKQMEALNPGGPRITLIRQIDALIKAVNEPDPAAPSA